MGSQSPAIERCTAPPTAGMMTVLSKRYVAPLIKALKPRKTQSTFRQGSRALCAAADKSGSSLPTEADVVIIGGGSLGCQTLYHLAKMGVTNTLLLEKEQLTAGITVGRYMDPMDPSMATYVYS